jgi:adenosylhomocysteine nucleosidase
LKILVTFALDNEFAHWRRLRTFVRVAGMLYPAFDTRIGEAQLRVALTGAGAVPARRVTSQAMSFEPAACVFSGLAGALKPPFHRGQILAAARVFEELENRFHQADADLLKAAEAAGATCVGVFVTTSGVVLTAAEKRRLGRLGDAVDMESWWNMKEAASRCVPAVAIRAISDSADEDMPLDFNRIFDARGNVQVARVIGSLARAPHRLPALLRLGYQSQRAARALARFLDAYVQALAAAGSSSDAELVEVAAR